MQKQFWRSIITINEEEEEEEKEEDNKKLFK